MSVSAVQRLAELFPPSRTVIVSNGFEGWNTWLFVEVYRGETGTYESNSIYLTSVFILNAGITGDGAAGRIKRDIDKALAQGHQVVAGDLWTRQRQDWVQSMTTIIDVQKAEVFYDALRGAFLTGRSWETPVGHFVELLPK
jgi:hypothetical protein